MHICPGVSRGNNDISAPAALGDFLPHPERTLGSAVCNARHLEDAEERRGTCVRAVHALNMHVCRCVCVCVHVPTLSLSGKFIKEKNPNVPLGCFSAEKTHINGTLLHRNLKKVQNLMIR